MPTPRSALECARQIAAKLGEPWSARSVDDVEEAWLEGPQVDLLLHLPTPGSRNSPVRVEVWSRLDLLPPEPGEFPRVFIGPASDPEGLAQEVSRTVLPRWRKVEAELEARTEKARSALHALAAEARAAAGPDASVHYGTRPNVATLRWGERHRATLKSTPDGDVTVSRLELDDLAAEVALDMIRNCSSAG